LEDCLRATAELGVKQLGIFGAKMLPTYPFVTERFQGEFNEMCDKYDVKCISYGANMDREMRTDRDLTEDEIDVKINDQ
jgi:sugar phosphate isomerase/epimerase